MSAVKRDVTVWHADGIHFGAVGTDLDIELQPLDGDARPLREYMTTFPLVPVVLDPYTNESSWILDTARRVLSHFQGAGCRPCWIVTCDVEQAKTYLGPYGEEFLAFADPNRTIVKSMDLSSLPALLMVRQDGQVVSKAEGWDSTEWREVTEFIAEATHWSRPPMPADGDPGPFSGTPAAG